MRFRFSIASMMAAIVIIALSFAALRINSAFCGGIILLTTLALLCRRDLHVPRRERTKPSGLDRLRRIRVAVLHPGIWTCSE